MYLRALGSLVTRRFSPRGIPRTQAQAQSSPGLVSHGALGAAAGRPGARSLHTLRDVVVGDGALGAAAVAASVGLLGFVYLKDKSADEEARKDASDQEAVKEEEEGMNEEFYKARFEDWMKENFRCYRNKEEKAMRYQIFKKVAMDFDKSKALGKTNLDAPNGYADFTEDELNVMNGTRREDEERLRRKIAKKNLRLSQRQAMSDSDALALHIAEQAAAEARRRSNQW